MRKEVIGNRKSKKDRKDIDHGKYKKTTNGLQNTT